MPTFEFSILHANLDEILSDIRSCDFTSASKAKVYKKYKHLYRQYSKLSPEVINTQFSSEEIKAISFLSLGFENEERFTELLKQFKFNSISSARNIANFIKSAKGAKLLQSGGGLSNLSEEELTRIFGSLFGVQLANDCVKSLRAEKVGNILCYALSGLLDDHLKEFANSQDKVEFIRNQIADSEYVLHYKKEEVGPDTYMRGWVTEKKHTDSINPANCVDHCFINFRTKQIIVGQSTSNDDTGPQKLSLDNAFLAASALKASGLSWGSYHMDLSDFEIVPVCLMSGRLQMEDDNELGQGKGSAFKRMFPKASKEEVNTLGQIQFFRLFGNTVNPHQALVCALTNPHIGGVDTEDLYNFSQKLLSTPKESQNEAIFDFLIKKITSAVTTLNDGEIRWNAGADGQLDLLIDDLTAIIKNLPFNFNFSLSHEKFASSLAPLYGESTKLQEKIEALVGNSRLSLYEDFRNAIDTKIKNWNTFTEEVQRCSKWQSRIHFAGAADYDEIFTHDDFQTIIDSIKKVGVYLGRRATSGYWSAESSLVNNYLRNLQLQLTDFRCRELSDSYKVSVSKFISSSSNTEFVEFIDKTRFLLHKKRGHGRAESPQETQQRLKEVCSQDLLDYLNQKSQEIANEYKAISVDIAKVKISPRYQAPTCK